MDGRDYKNYKITFNQSKNLSHLNSTFSASPVFDEVLTKHYNVQETVHVLKSNDP